VGKSTVELYCDLDRLQVPGGGLIPADVMVQKQRPDLVIIDRSVYGRFRIALVELTCPWDTYTGAVPTACTHLINFGLKDLCEA
jgi:hypothetical protein